MRIVEVEQRTPEWFAARAGKLTGSRASDMLAKIKTGEAAGRRDLRTQLALETITRRPLDGDGYCSKEMQRGIDLDPAALAIYEALSGNVVRKTGFIVHDDLPVGCSVDGDVDAFTGILELKCPKPATHLAYLKGGVLPPEYVGQVTHNLWVSGAEWCDFASFDDRFPDELQMFLIRVKRTDLDLAAYAKTVSAFLKEIADEIATIRQLIGVRTGIGQQVAAGAA